MTSKIALKHPTSILMTETSLFKEVSQTKRAAKIAILTTIIFGSLSGCTTLDDTRNHQATLDAIQVSETKISSNLVRLEENSRQQVDHINNLESKVTKLSTQLDQINNKLKSSAKATPVSIANSTASQAASQRNTHTVVLGEIEKVQIDTIKKKFDARIDTGATTSSLNAVEVQEFERDGKTWVKFQLFEPSVSQEQRVWIEAPILRYTKIRQSTSEEAERRAVIELWVRLGPIYEKAQFTLADRSHMSNPILLGREFMQDIALVDVSKKYIHGQ